MIKVLIPQSDNIKIMNSMVLIYTAWYNQNILFLWRNKMGIRGADFAGTWYPGSEKECVQMIKEMDTVSVPTADFKGYGGIVPHAGWYFSGKTALSVFKSIKSRKNPDVFFLFGMHLPPGGGNYIFYDDGLRTPLGILKVNKKIANALLDSFNLITENSTSYTRDNTIELQLPLIKYFFPETTVVTLGVSPTAKAIEIGEEVATIAERLGLNVCIIGSTDLTHYGPGYGFTPQGIGSKSVKWVKDTNDREIIDAFLNIDPLEIIQKATAMKNACCPGSAAAAVAGVKKLGAKKGVLVQYTTSYDIHPDSSFVGYAGVIY